jgi:hemolysin D
MLALKSKQNELSKSNSLDSLAFESATAEVIARHHPMIERSMIYTLAAFMAFIMIFISVKKIDRVVTATGRLVPTGGTITVQPLDKAIINQILVSQGQIVKKGQVLATCDPTFAEADLVGLKAKIESLEAEKTRIEAEEGSGPPGTSNAQPYHRLQATISSQRLDEYRAGVADFDERIGSAEAQAAGFRKSIEDYQAELKISTEQESMYSKLEEEKVTSHLQTITVTNQRVELARLLSTAEASLDGTEHTLESLKAQRKSFVEKWHGDDLNNLVAVDNLLDEARDDFAKAQRTRDLVNLTSPADAIVLKIPDLSQGAVAQDAEPLFSLVALDAPLEVDAEIDAKDSGFVRIGDQARIKFDAFQFMEHGVAEGEVKTISQDAFTEESNQDSVTKATYMGTSAEQRTPYFDSRIKLKAIKLHDVPRDMRLSPGMTLTADIIVGHRTILWYILGGALRSGSEGMREP